MSSLNTYQRLERSLEVVGHQTCMQCCGIQVALAVLQPVEAVDDDGLAEVGDLGSQIDVQIIDRSGDG